MSLYPQRELANLAEVKAGLQHRIRRRRAESLAHLERIEGPLRWIDRAYGYWKRFAPLAKLAGGPIGVWLFRSVFRRRKLTGHVVRWGPMLFNMLRGFTRARAGRAAA